MPIYLRWPSIIVALIVFCPVGLWLLATRISRDKLTLSLVLGWLPGAVLVWKGRRLRAQGMEIRRFLGIVTKQEISSISAIAAAVNLSPDVVIETLSGLIEDGYLDHYRLNLDLNRIDHVGSKDRDDDSPSRELRVWTCGACSGGNKRYIRMAEPATCEYCGVAQSG
jgi:hypothetical protein